MSSIKVLYFASVAERLGIREEVHPLPFSLRIEDLKGLLTEKHPSLKDVMKHSRFALNQEFTKGNPELKAGDEIAIIPPVSGG